MPTISLTSVSRRLHRPDGQSRSAGTRGATGASRVSWHSGRPRRHRPAGRARSDRTSGADRTIQRTFKSELAPRRHGRARFRRHRSQVSGPTPLRKHHLPRQRRHVCYRKQRFAPGGNDRRRSSSRRHHGTHGARLQPSNRFYRLHRIYRSRGADGPSLERDGTDRGRFERDGSDRFRLQGDRTNGRPL